MRQVGILAAAGHYALDNNIARLQEDHSHAKQIAIALHAIDPTIINPEKVETNIVGLELSQVGIGAAELAARCKEAGLWISALGPYYARLVTHLDFDGAQCNQAIEILLAILRKAFVAK
jgi:threonine aldolase